MTNPETNAWPRTAPPPLAHAVLRTSPEDFLVEELLDIPFAGTGEHVWLRIRKRGVNTDRVAQSLARVAGVPRRAVGYAGMKDRHAVATQWFSVHLPGREPPAWDGLGDGVEVLEAVRHTRKLHVGTLMGNRFTLVLRQCHGDRAALAQRLVQVQERGVPNYFGEQRFGREDGNVSRAQAVFAGTEIVRDRHLHGMYLSAARSFLFNTVLARRVAECSWDRLLDGEACVLDGSRSFFVVDGVDAILQRRLTERDIHPSGPLWGRGELPTRGAARALEESVVLQHEELARGLVAADLRMERRALRVFARELEATWPDETTLKLRFSLPTGCFATVLMRELANCHDFAAKV